MCRQNEFKKRNTSPVKFNLTSSFLLSRGLFPSTPPIAEECVILFLWNICYNPWCLSGFIHSELDPGLCGDIVHTRINESPCCSGSFVVLTLVTHWYSSSLFVLMGGVITKAAGRQLFFIVCGKPAVTN